LYTDTGIPSPTNGHITSYIDGHVASLNNGHIRRSRRTRSPTHRWTRRPRDGHDAHPRDTPSIDGHTSPVDRHDTPPTNRCDALTINRHDPRPPTNAIPHPPMDMASAHRCTRRPPARLPTQPSPTDVRDVSITGGHNLYAPMDTTLAHHWTQHPTHHWTRPTDALPPTLMDKTPLSIDGHNSALQWARHLTFDDHDASPTNEHAPHPRTPHESIVPRQRHDNDGNDTR
jgi:hypothetical protein